MMQRTLDLTASERPTIIWPFPAARDDLEAEMDAWVLGRMTDAGLPHTGIWMCSIKMEGKLLLNLNTANSKLVLVLGQS